ncbi:MAG: Smr/MutS family protein [Chloroflexota bacterium]
MDTKSLHTLEFDKIRHLLAGYTSFSAGEELARNLRPTVDLFEAQQWQEETQEAYLLFNTDLDITIGGARDVRRSADNSVRGFVLPAEDILAIRGTIVAARTLGRQLRKVEDEYPRLAEIAYLIEECPGIVSAITQTIDDRGIVLDSASAKLAKIRQQQRVVHAKIQDKLQRILNSSMNQYLQEPIVTQRNGRYVLPVKSDAKGRLRGIVHDQSGSGATLWMEPLGTVDLNNEYRGLFIEEQEEINRILRELSAKIAEQADSIKRVVERMAELDLIFARARYAHVYFGIQPEFVEWREFEKPKPPKHPNERAKWVPPPPNLHPGSTVWVKGARHPLLPPDEVIPTNWAVDEETFVVLITGPNTGGKTVSMKTLGLMVLMAQSGLHLPATDAKLTLFNRVFADIGDEQSIEQSLSTFSAHMSNIVRILDEVDDRSLVLLDELGSGTDPTEGAALAMSITNYLRDKGATTFIATHYPELKIYASQTKGAINASMLFDVETLSPTYELSIGIPGRSNAFAIARRLGVDETILDEAMKYVGVGSNEAENLLDAIHDLRERIEAEEAATRLAQKDAELARDLLKERLEQIEQERKQVLRDTKRKAEKEVHKVRDELRRVRRQIRDAESINALKKASKAVDEVEAEKVQGIAPEAPKQKTPTALLKKLRKALQPGDVVKLKTLNTKGEIVSISKNQVVVAVGRLTMKAKLSELEFVERPSAEEEVTIEIDEAPMVSSVNIELDIRGERVESGLTKMNRYIDNAFLARMPWVRIIHGKGTGKLRAAVRQSLSGNNHVTSWEEGKQGEGGPGVTVAKLVKHN